jgi:hypothetical protein
MTTRAMVVSLAAVLAAGVASAPHRAPPARRLSRRVLDDEIRMVQASNAALGEDALLPTLGLSAGLLVTGLVLYAVGQKIDGSARS